MATEQDPDDSDDTVPEIGQVDNDADGLADSGLRPTRMMTVWRIDLDDAFPLNPNEISDLDGDGIGDNADKI